MRETEYSHRKTYYTRYMITLYVSLQLTQKEEKLPNSSN